MKVLPEAEMNPRPRLPFFIKASLFLVGMFAFFSMLYIAKDLILPLLYALIVAIALSPLVNFLLKKKVNRTLAIALVLLLTLLVAAGLIALIVSQASMLSEAWPQLIKKFDLLLREAVTWASGYFNISTRKINTWITNSTDELLNSISAGIGATLATMGGVLAATFLTPVYICMILFYQPLLVEFTHKVFGAGNDARVSDILSQTKTIVQSYLVGLFSEFVIVAILNSIGLLILGIDYAILLGIAGAFLNVIPYIGGIIGVALFMIIALVTKAPIYVLYVAGLYSLIQFIDNHYIVPKIVGSKVKLNALVSIVAVISGAALWGIPGMFLSIPLTAIIKLICDRIESLKPWGFLLGSEDSVPGNMKFNFTIKGFLRNFTSKKQ